MLSKHMYSYLQAYDFIKQASSILYNSGCFLLNNFGLSKKYSPATAKNSISDVPP